MPEETIDVTVDGVVVGVDGSAGSEEALDWALHEARGRSCGLELLTAWYPGRDARQVERLSSMTSTDELEDEVLRDQAPALAAAVSRTGTERVPIKQQMRYGHPAKVLIDAASPDRLLVVGSRGRGAIIGSLLGSVSQLCAQYARGPMVVVRGQQPHRIGGGRVVVGVDGSSSSVKALRFAGQAAARRGAVLDVVHGYAVLSWPTTGESPEEEAATVIDNSLRRGRRNIGKVEVIRHLAEGPDYAVLLAAAQGADLLVVGSRGHGGWKGLLLGSVSLHCISQAPCPVAVIHGGDERAEDSV